MVGTKYTLNTKKDKTANRSQQRIAERMVFNISYTSSWTSNISWRISTSNFFVNSVLPTEKFDNIDFR